METGKWTTLPSETGYDYSADISVLVWVDHFRTISGTPYQSNQLICDIPIDLRIMTSVTRFSVKTADYIDPVCSPRQLNAVLRSPYGIYVKVCSIHPAQATSDQIQSKYFRWLLMTGPNSKSDLSTRNVTLHMQEGKSWKKIYSKN